jgi:AraC-like DNA-binding protein
LGSGNAGYDTTVERELFLGLAGLRRMSGRARIEAADPDRFHAEYRTLPLTVCHFDSFRVSACSGVIESQQPSESEFLQLGTVVAGRSRWRSGEDSHDQERGVLHLLRGFDRVQFDWPEPAQFLDIRFPASALPPHLLEEGVLRTGVLPQTPLTNGLVGFIRQLAAGPIMLNATERGHLDQALRTLGTAVMATAAADAQAAEDELRYAIHDYIERHLLEQSLDPSRIGAALGVSVRWVHHVFSSGGGESISRYIRHRRLDMVTAAIRAGSATSGVSQLSQQFGFAGRDHLNRAFRGRYGMTVREYQERVRAGLALPDPSISSVGGEEQEQGWANG